MSLSANLPRTPERLPARRAKIMSLVPGPRALLINLPGSRITTRSVGRIVKRWPSQRPSSTSIRTRSATLLERTSGRGADSRHSGLLATASLHHQALHPAFRAAPDGAYDKNPPQSQIPSPQPSPTLLRPAYARFSTVTFPPPSPAPCHHFGREQLRGLARRRSDRLSKVMLT